MWFAAALDEDVLPDESFDEHLDGLVWGVDTPRSARLARALKALQAT